MGKDLELEDEALPLLEGERERKNHKVEKCTPPYFKTSIPMSCSY